MGSVRIKSREVRVRNLAGVILPFCRTMRPLEGLRGFVELGRASFSCFFAKQSFN